MNIKLIIVILRGADRDRLLHRLNDANLRATEFASMGGFLRHKNTTLLIGLPADQVDTALTIIRETCPTPEAADEHRATIFVLSASQSIAV
jgi:uncharacterized protein YaaQ